MKKIWIISLLVSFVWVSSGSAEFYRFKDAHGNMIYTDDLSKVPEVQRSQAVIYDESSSGTPMPAPEKKPTAIRPPLQEGAEKMEDLKKEGQRLMAVKAQLAGEYDELVAENAKLKAQQNEAVTPDQIKAVNRQVVSFNTRFQAYQEKNAAYQAEIEAYNKRLQAAESKNDANASQKGEQNISN